MLPPIHPFLFFVLLCIIGSLCAYQANKRGRHPTTWFVIGVFFGLLGLAVLYLLPSKQVSLNDIRKKSSLATKPVPYRFPTPSDPHQLWHYLDESAQTQGPMSLYALRDAFDKKKIISSTYVWNEKMKNWKRISDLPDLFGQLQDAKNPS